VTGIEAIARAINNPLVRLPLIRIPKGYGKLTDDWEFEQTLLLLPPKLAYMSFNTLDLSLAIPNIGDESRTDVSAYWVKGNGLKV